MELQFTLRHRGGSGSPLLCVHGFTDTWRTWELVLPALERRHDVLAPTLPGHAGGPPLGDAVGVDALVDELERELDAAGWERAHVVGNSLGGFLALALAARGRAQSVVALAPAGGWEASEGAWPRAAARMRREWLPQADWVELPDVGHCPQLDVPLETAQLVLGFVPA